jgi:AmiR/NasT family two-component response regulator
VSSDTEPDEEMLLGAAGRARLYRARAAAIEAQLTGTDLPRLKEKLRMAADRFHELAQSEERLVERKARLAAVESKRRGFVSAE